METYAIRPLSRSLAGNSVSTCTRTRRRRMHDPVPQTGNWLKSVVQGYFNYHAVPGNLDSLGMFRERVLSSWWRALRRRSQRSRITWARMLQLADRWLPTPRELHPYPDAHFLA